MGREERQTLAMGNTAPSPNSAGRGNTNSGIKPVSPTPLAFPLFLPSPCPLPPSPSRSVFTKAAPLFSPPSPTPGSVFPVLKLPRPWDTSLLSAGHDPAQGPRARSSALPSPGLRTHPTQRGHAISTCGQVSGAGSFPTCPPLLSLGDTKPIKVGSMAPRGSTVPGQDGSWSPWNEMEVSGAEATQVGRGAAYLPLGSWPLAWVLFPFLPDPTLGVTAGAVTRTFPSCLFSSLVTMVTITATPPQHCGSADA